MSLTCCDCGTEIHRKHQRGAKPKRCSACKKLRAAFRARCWRNANLDHARESERARRQKKAHVVQCATCDKSFEAKRPHAKYCSPKCKNKSRSNRQGGKYEHVCRHCQNVFKCDRKTQPYCSVECRCLASRKTVIAICARAACGKQFETLPGRLANGHRFCCRECSYNEPLVCQNPKCGKQFRMQSATKNQWKNKGKYCCHECYCDHRFGEDRPRITRSKSARKNAGNYALANSLRKRCKQYGVTFDPACTRQAVLDRDGWICQKCGIACNKEYVFIAGTRSPHQQNAEHDHIIPLSVPGSPGNVFENSQCLCRKCNSRKRNKPEGQLRLGLEEEAWGVGVRVRSQLSSRSSEATQATVL